MSATTHSPVRPKRSPEDTARERSPNRKEREPVKRWRSKANSRAVETKKERIVNGVAVGKTRDEAAIAAGVSPSGLESLLKTHPGFREKVEKGEEEYRKVAAGVIDESLEEVAKEVVKIALKGEDERTRASTGLRLLQGRGVLVEKQEQHQNGPIEHILRVVYDEPGQRGVSPPSRPALPSG